MNSVKDNVVFFALKVCNLIISAGKSLLYSADTTIENNQL